MTTIEPLWALWITFEVIAPTPGLAQSLGSTSQLTVVIRRAWARWIRPLLTPPSGGRKSQGRNPGALRIRRLVSCSDAEEGSISWWSEWLPISLPWARIFLIVEILPAVSWPISKKVACESKRRSTRRTWGVYSLGPSSKPIAILFRPRGPWVTNGAPP